MRNERPTIKLFSDFGTENKVDEEHLECSSFVGLRVSQNVIELHYPETCPPSFLARRWASQEKSLPNLSVNLESFSSDELLELRRYICLILHPISLLDERNIVSDFFDNTGKTNKENDPILSCLWLLDDYSRNGVPKQRNRVFQNDKGKSISWSKTTKTQAFIADDRLFYPHLIFSNIRWEESLITSLYLFCVKRSAKFLGWLFGLSESMVEVADIDEKHLEDYSLFLLSVLSKTFNEQKRIRLKHMLAVLKGPAAKTRSDVLNYGTFNFNLVFEKMATLYFSNVGEGDKEKLFPRAEWHYQTNPEGVPSSALEPDTLRIDHQDELLILDSKYYRYGSSPATQSVEKQFTYADHACRYGSKLNNGRPFRRIDSVFLLPFTSNDPHSSYQYFGYAKAPWRANTESVIMPFIIGFYVDLGYLLHNYEKPSADDVNRFVGAIKTSSEMVRGLINERHA